MPPYKRKLMSESAWRSNKRSASSSAKKDVVRMKPTQKAKMLSILKGHTETAATIERKATTALAQTAESFCVHSTDVTGVADAANGQLGQGEDSAMLNFLDIRGFAVQDHSVDTVTTGSWPAAIRLLLVRFNKAKLQPDASGTLPPVTEVLESNEFEAMVIDNDANAGRFQILSDKIFTVPANGQAISTGGIGTGVGRVNFNYRVKINKRIDFVKAGNSSTPNGHYDSGQEFGQVNRGLCVLYAIAEFNGAQFQPMLQLQTRLNFTA